MSEKPEKLSELQLLEFKEAFTTFDKDLKKQSQTYNSQNWCALGFQNLEPNDRTAPGQYPPKNYWELCDP